MKTALDDFIDEAMYEFQYSGVGRVFYAPSSFPNPPLAAIKVGHQVLVVDVSTELFVAKRDTTPMCRTCGQEIHAPR